MESKFFKKGEVIIKEGSIGSCAYMIESGQVEVSSKLHETKTMLTVLGEKQVFGEMGLIEDKPRSATIIALEDTSVRMISRESFNTLFIKNKNVALSIVRALFDRLRNASDTIATNNARKAKRVKEKFVTVVNGEDAGTDTDTDTDNVKIIIKDKRYLVMSAINDMAVKVLKYDKIEIKEFPFKIGRSATVENDQTDNILTDNHLFVYEKEEPYTLSENHFLFDKVEGHFVIVDRGSKSGVIVNGMKINGCFVIDKKENNIIVVGDSDSFEFNIEIKGELETEVVNIKGREKQ